MTTCHVTVELTQERLKLWVYSITIPGVQSIESHISEQYNPVFVRIIEKLKMYRYSNYFLLYCKFVSVRKARIK